MSYARSTEVHRGPGAIAAVDGVTNKRRALRQRMAKVSAARDRQLAQIAQRPHAMGMAPVISGTLAVRRAALIPEGPAAGPGAPAPRPPPVILPPPRLPTPIPSPVSPVGVRRVTAGTLFTSGSSSPGGMVTGGGTFGTGTTPAGGTVSGGTSGGYTVGTFPQPGASGTSIDPTAGAGGAGGGVGSPTGGSGSPYDPSAGTAPAPPVPDVPPDLPDPGNLTSSSFLDSMSSGEKWALGLAAAGAAYLLFIRKR